MIERKRRMQPARIQNWKGSFANGGFPEPRGLERSGLKPTPLSRPESFDVHGTPCGKGYSCLGLLRRGIVWRTLF